jgi:hypothetical protein
MQLLDCMCIRAEHVMDCRLQPVETQCPTLGLHGLGLLGTCNQGNRCSAHQVEHWYEGCSAK